MAEMYNTISTFTSKITETNAPNYDKSVKKSIFSLTFLKIVCVFKEASFL
eukprot:TRINITY_DN12190_c0_g1_i1.p1 TRINITY_DN12190_c0_g1~~TRINITY_DN12190_c0_g1_i1.p1  ORF type:complete len:50 (+),score=5.99 TRINITY_DN12190_c0_g1_i1:439-588(+)